jgi:creatinine amidohydrolase/Fe(II)-dependent formamide hydrolase-like protein
VAEVSTPKLGKVLSDAMVSSLVQAIKDVKADEQSLRLQEEYFKNVKQ